MTYVLIVLAVALLVRISLYWKAIDLEGLYNNGSIYFGHRGERYNTPENTITAYNSAIHNGLKAIELDVRLTKDGQIVCSHNVDLERETTGSGFINELTYAELSPFRAGKDFPKNKQDKIPLFLEVLEKLPENILINIEIKVDTPFDLGTARAILKLIKEEKIQQKLIVSSFNPIVVRYIKLISKKTPTAFIYEYANHFKGMFIARADCLHPHAEFVDNKLIKFCKKRKIRINTWTVNNQLARDWLLKEGVDGIITDFPKLAT